MTARTRLSIGIVVMLVLCSFGFQSIKASPRLAAPRAPETRRDDDPDQDQEIFRFSTVGDSRQDPVSPDPTTLPLSGQDTIWLQNTKAFSRILESILEQRASILFFNGDMIMGYGKAVSPDSAGVTLTVPQVVGSDLVKFYRQYAYWRGMIAGVMERGTYVVPVPGNHETQWKAGGKIALAVNEDAWRANMGDLILDDARFQTLLGQAPTSVNVGDNGPADLLTTDQSKLSYSFDFNGSHFVVINTDPTGSDAHAPTSWLASDLGAAQARGVKHLFVFGHKPAFTYYYGASSPLPTSPSGLDKFVASRDAFWDVIETYGAIYFCGHEHIFHMSQPRLETGGKAWQVIVGSGGSPFEAAPTDSTLNPDTDRDYAWATVKVYRNGKVKITVYGFDDHYGPTRVIQTATIHEGDSGSRHTPSRGPRVAQGGSGASFPQIPAPGRKKSRADARFLPQSRWHLDCGFPPLSNEVTHEAKDPDRSGRKHRLGIGPPLPRGPSPKPGRGGDPGPRGAPRRLRGR